MTISAASRGKTRNSHPVSPLEEIQVGTGPNPEPLGLSSESKNYYFLILCDRFSRTFRLIGIQDKSTDACIDVRGSIPSIHASVDLTYRNTRQINRCMY